MLQVHLATLLVSNIWRETQDPQVVSFLHMSQVARVVSVEALPSSDKLYKTKVEVAGGETRQVSRNAHDSVWAVWQQCSGGGCCQSAFFRPACPDNVQKWHSKVVWRVQLNGRGCAMRNLRSSGPSQSRCVTCRSSPACGSTSSSRSWRAPS